MTTVSGAPPSGVPSRTCLVCGTSLGGALGGLLRLVGVRRSAQNPNLCNRCDAHIEDGRIVELAVFFADLSGYTRLTHSLGADRTYQVLDRFLRVATDVIVRWDGFVTQFVGDEVMAFFNVPVARDDYRSRVAAAAAELQAQMPRLSDELGLEVDTTIGIAAGHARVGLVGAEGIRHYSAIGDVVNRAARLVAHVEPGGTLVDETIYTDVADAFPAAERESILVKGFDAPLAVARLRGSPKPAAEVPADPSPGRWLRFVTALSAVLGAPCAGILALSPVGVALGIGSLGIGGLLVWLDQAAVRIPLLGLAMLGVVANGVVLAAGRADAKRRTTEGIVLPQTRSERWRTHAGVALSVAAAAVVAFELVAHEIMHG